MSLLNDNCSLALNLKSENFNNVEKFDYFDDDNYNSHGTITKISMNFANMIGPAV